MIEVILQSLIIIAVGAFAFAAIFVSKGAIR